MRGKIIGMQLATRDENKKTKTWHTSLNMNGRTKELIEVKYVEGVDCRVTTFLISIEICLR